MYFLVLYKSEILRDKESVSYFFHVTVLQSGEQRVGVKRVKLNWA